jgi:phage terminase small subunit
MGVLTSPKQEAFAQELAKGATVMKAYAAAGYPPSKGNAYRLRLRGPVVARLAELVAARSAVVQAAAISAAERAGVDQFWVLRNLRTNAVMAMRRNDRAAAARSIELIGKHLGMFIDKKSIEISMVDDSDEYLAKIMAIVEGKVIDQEPAPPLQIENGHDEEEETG